MRDDVVICAVQAYAVYAVPNAITYSQGFKDDSFSWHRYS